MNIYFLVEGRRTEKKVYPKWLSHLIPKIKEIDNPFDVTDNNFYVFNGNGFPSLLDNHLKNAVSDVNEIGKFNYLVICLDSDDDSVAERKNYVLKFIEDNNLELKNSEFVIIVQNKCIETWFLGNRKVYTRSPQSKALREYNKFFNVQVDNPELMGSLGDATSAQFHASYLIEMLSEKNIRYTKRNPSGVTDETYLNELIKRQRETDHLCSLKDFIDFCSSIIVV